VLQCPGPRIQLRVSSTHRRIVLGTVPKLPSKRTGKTLAPGKRSRTRAWTAAASSDAGWLGFSEDGRIVTASVLRGAWSARERSSASSWRVPQDEDPPRPTEPLGEFGPDRADDRVSLVLLLEVWEHHDRYPEAFRVCRRAVRVCRPTLSSEPADASMDVKNRNKPRHSVKQAIDPDPFDRQGVTTAPGTGNHPGRQSQAESGLLRATLETGRLRTKPGNTGD
jgi:hypothetical protein